MKNPIYITEGIRPSLLARRTTSPKTHASQNIATNRENETKQQFLNNEGRLIKPEKRK